MITKTGIHVDESSSFNNPQIYEENGEVNHVVADNLTPSTRYYTRAYVVSDGTTVYSGNIKSFETLAPLPDYFTIKNEYAGSNTITLYKLGNPTNDITLDYSTDDGSTWTTWSSANGNLSVNLAQGESINFRGDNATFSTGEYNFYTFGSIYNISASGNIMTLVDSTGQSTSLANYTYCFHSLFVNAYLVSINSLLLPATTLATNCYESIFHNCKITTIPSNLLPATTLANGCYTRMFSGCTSLTTIPSNLLPATTLASYCYQYMFGHCSSLTTIPSNLLPATTLASYCYDSLFSYCTSLTSAPVLPATTLAYGCYRNMFYNCTSLVNPPALPATTLANGCYNSMFSYCTSLTSAPVLPATTLADYCYNNMFSYCTSLTSAPVLPATTLTTYCYKDMFNGCTLIDRIVTHANDISASYCLNNWLANVAASGELINMGTATYTINSASGIPSGWVERIPDYFTITNEYAGANTIKLTKYHTPTNNITLDYSTDNGSTWTTWSSANGDLSVNLAQGQSVKFRGDNDTFSYSDDPYYYFSTPSNRNISLSGNIMTLLDATGISTTIPCNYCFYKLFRNTRVISISGNLLPATTLKRYCYSRLFSECIYLVSVPSNLLPATTLAVGCYSNMFATCRSLTNAPDLPATTLAQSAYSGMFNQCALINSIKTYANDISASNCLNNWLSGVAASGDFYRLGSATYSSGASGIPSGWVEHTSL